MANPKYEPQKKYIERTRRRFVINLNTNTDGDIIARLEAQENVQGYLKDLIYADMKREASEEGKKNRPPRKSRHCSILGMQFGDYMIKREWLDEKVMNWACEAECVHCGGTRISYTHMFTNGRTVNCPECKKKRNDPSGKRYNDLTVLRTWMEPREQKNGKTVSVRRCEARCELCGNVIECDFHLLKKGNKKNCGCVDGRMHKDQTGKKFGDYIIDREWLTDSGTRRRCEVHCVRCNGKKETYLDRVTSGKIAPCKCTAEGLDPLIGQQIGDFVITRTWIENHIAERGKHKGRTNSVRKCEMRCVHCGKMIERQYYGRLNKGKLAPCACMKNNQE